MFCNPNHLGVSDLPMKVYILLQSNHSLWSRKYKLHHRWKLHRNQKWGRTRYQSLPTFKNTLNKSDYPNPTNDTLNLWALSGFSQKRYILLRPDRSLCSRRGKIPKNYPTFGNYHRLVYICRCYWRMPFQRIWDKWYLAKDRRKDPTIPHSTGWYRWGINFIQAHNPDNMFRNCHFLPMFGKNRLLFDIRYFDWRTTSSSTRCIDYFPISCSRNFFLPLGSEERTCRRRFRILHSTPRRFPTRCWRSCIRAWPSSRLRSCWSRTFLSIRCRFHLPMFCIQSSCWWVGGTRDLRTRGRVGRGGVEREGEWPKAKRRNDRS